MERITKTEEQAKTEVILQYIVNNKIITLEKFEMECYRQVSSDDFRMTSTKLQINL